MRLALNTKKEYLFECFAELAAQEYADIDVGINECIDNLAEEVKQYVYKQGALQAGIPKSVVEGKTSLRDHFSQEYIDWKCNRINKDRK